MDKRMQLLGKIGTILADFIGIIVMLMAVAFAFARENPAIFVVLAAFVCPLWYKVVQKSWLKEKPIVSVLIRAVIIIGGYFLLTQAIKWNPYNRCHESVAREKYQQHFEKTYADKGYKFGEVGEIAKKEMWDYLKLTAPVSYKDESGKDTTQDITLYFDRVDGKFYKDFAGMQEYRKSYREQYKERNFRDRQFFDDEKLDAAVTEYSTYLVEDQYDVLHGKMDGELQKKVTEKIWEGWRQKAASLGGFQKLETPVEKNWFVTDDENHIQTMEVKAVLSFAEGKLTVKMVFHDDLTLQSMEVS
jgi:hypothetical protein